MGTYKTKTNELCGGVRHKLTDIEDSLKALKCKNLSPSFYNNTWNHAELECEKLAEIVKELTERIKNRQI